MLNAASVTNKILKKKFDYIPQDESLRLEFRQTDIISNAILISGFFITIFFATALQEKAIEIRIFEYIASFILLLSFLFKCFWNGSGKVYYLFGKIIPVTTFCILFASLYYRGGNDGFVGIWILLTPIFTIFVLGKTYGLIVSLIMWFWILINGFIPKNEYHFFYDNSITLRYFLTYFAVLLLTFIYEHIRSQNYKKISSMYNELKKINNDLERLGFLDPLTEINNLQGFRNNSNSLRRLAIRENKPLSFAMLSIDSFDKLNNSYGQYISDTALKMVAELLKNCAFRPLDMIVRIEGEKFGALFFDTDIKHAAWIAEKLRADIELHTIKLPDGNITKITVSIGVSSQIPEDGLPLDDLINTADKNLDKAKTGGKNRVISE